MTPPLTEDFPFFSSRSVFYGFAKFTDMLALSCRLFISSVHIKFYNHDRSGFIPYKYTAAHLHKGLHRQKFFHLIGSTYIIITKK